jgi:hypothetical protein
MRGMELKARIKGQRCSFDFTVGSLSELLERIDDLKDFLTEAITAKIQSGRMKIDFDADNGAHLKKLILETANWLD